MQFFAIASLTVNVFCLIRLPNVWLHDLAPRQYAVSRANAMRRSLSLTTAAVGDELTRDTAGAPNQLFVPYI